MPIYKRLLVTQKRDDLYLVWAKHDERHVRYLQGTLHDNQEDLPFLTMVERGPFSVKKGQSYGVIFGNHWRVFA
ncbi:hypothetical protein BO71DRAFT_398914 [Aspergillus ellipticus CBS 707.79]|uniref:Uncharacterized protein n=1 Tax=Aspergillus ellipticus CBS 707.79 TaxID=1448320 RepID=A0A319DJV7_9EURO|nr:hypothetical protein BO71DRAFT_398914 [Aspergillus ellipticus CBS 707.79]